MKKYLVKTFLMMAIGLIFVGCLPYKLPDQMVTDHYDIKQIKENLNGYRYDNERGAAKETRELGVPKEGSKNFYFVEVTAELEQAYRSYLAGDIDEAIKALDAMKKKEKDDDLLWQETHQRIKTLLLAGKGEDALALIPRCIKYEKRVFGGNLSCISLQGEVNTWLEHYDKAEADFLNILQTTDDWELPSAYISIPLNMKELVNTATSQIRAITGLAMIYFFKKDFKESFYWAKQGEKRINTVLSLVNSSFYQMWIKPHIDVYYGSGTTLTILGAGYAMVDNDLKKSEALFKEATVYYQKIGLKRGEAFVPTIQSLSYLYAKKHGLALKSADKALSFVNRYGFFDLSWRIEVEKAKYLYENGQKDLAEKSFRNAQKTIRYISNSLGSDHSKVNFGVGKDGITNYLVKIDLDKKDYKQLFADLEEGRSRAFMDLFSGTVIENQHNSYLTKIKGLDEEILKYSIKIGANQSDVIFHEKLKSLREERKENLDLLRAQSPRLASAISIWSGKIEDFQANLKAHEKALYYFRVDGRLLSLVIRKKSVKLNRLGLTSQLLSSELDILYNQIASFDTRNKTRGLKLHKGTSGIAVSLKSFESQKKKIYSALGVGKDKATKTYIIPSGAVNFVPWGVLDIQNPFAILTSASLLNYPNELLKIKNQAVILGNPNFGGELPQLLGAEKEAEYIATIYKTKALTQNSATRTNLHSKIGQGTKILHLATHGTFDEKDPLASAIYLCKNGKADKVTARDIYKKPFKANLVILSACETGLGKSISGDDLLGLTRTFFLGGSTAVLNTLWEVDDEGTKEFMKVFHSYAKEGKYSKGYMKARSHLKNLGYSPSIYGAFILNGKDLE